MMATEQNFNKWHYLFVIFFGLVLLTLFGGTGCGTDGNNNVINGNTADGKCVWDQSSWGNCNWDN